MRKLTLSAVSITAVLGLSPLFSTAQAFFPGGSSTTCGGPLVNLAATRHDVEIGVECRCIDEECDTHDPIPQAVEVEPPVLMCSTKDRNIIEFVYALIGGPGGEVLVKAQKGHHGYTCTKLALEVK